MLYQVVVAGNLNAHLFSKNEHLAGGEFIADDMSNRNPKLD